MFLFITKDQAFIEFLKDLCAKVVISLIMMEQVDLDIIKSYSYFFKGGESIYGPTFHDENKKVQLDKAGVLAMLNKGPDTNNSNFFITFIDCSL